MSSTYEQLCVELEKKPRTWLVTGVGGFIGSNLLEQLLMLNQNVIGIDNFITGHAKNIESVKNCVGLEKWKNFRFVEEDITNLPVCMELCQGVDYILHQAALGSVPRSIDDPLSSNWNNVNGTLNMLWAAKCAEVKRFVFASSSSVYGDHPSLPKVEDQIGTPLSPYAITKYINELYAFNFSKIYNLEAIGLRYFNVFGRRQDPDGMYAAVIPKWVSQMLKKESPLIFGDGTTSRDFCYIDNVVQMNLLAATTQNTEALNRAYNVAFGEQTSLIDLFQIIKNGLASNDENMSLIKPQFEEFRKGDIKHSLADTSEAVNKLGYLPTHSVLKGMEEALGWYVENL